VRTYKRKEKDSDDWTKPKAQGERVSVPKPGAQETAISRESLWRKTQSRIFGGGPKGLRQSTTTEQQESDQKEDTLSKVKEAGKDKDTSDN